MPSAEGHAPRAPFPQLSDSIKAEYLIGSLSLRAFGICETDLGVDFGERRPPLLVTRLLACCTRDEQGKEVEEGFFWRLPVGKRIECLLRIATSSDRSASTVPLRCPNPSCAQDLEFEIAVEQLIRLQSQTSLSDRLSICCGDDRLVLRRPLGIDQLRWLKHSFPDEESAMKAMIQTLLSVDEGGASARRGVGLKDEWLPAIDQAMEEFDPLINFSLLVQCPYCDEQSRYEIDLQELSLRRLRQAQQNLLTTVHRLAKYYHWSEQQIFAVPPRRRSCYLALIEEDEKR